MKSTFVTTTVAGIAGLGVSAYGHSVQDGKIVPKRRNEEIATTVLLTASTVAANISHGHIIKRMHEKYASSYVESMSDEELAKALQQIGELDAEDEISLEYTKTK